MKTILGFLIGFRKFVMGLIYLIVATWLLIDGMVPPERWLDTTSTVIVAFMSTNVAESAIEFGKEWARSKGLIK